MLKTENNFWRRNNFFVVVFAGGRQRLLIAKAFTRYKQLLKDW